MKPLRAAALLLLSAALASAASITARETSATTTSPKLLNKSDEAFADVTSTRELRTDVTLSAQELAAGAKVEVFYCRPENRGRELAAKAEAVPDKLIGATTHKLTFESRKNWKDAWAARVVIDGKVVAVAAENDKALAWIKARKVEGAQ